MITYKKCTEVNEDIIFNAFQTGFSDYMINVNMPKDMFFKHFFGAEMNSLEYSFVALDSDEPVGLVLGGIKEFEGIKSLRCGALCVNPDYRGSKVSKKLFALHKQSAVENNCKQLLLEVIVGNDRAINFYKKMGYEKVYDLVYYSKNNLSEDNSILLKDITIKKIDIEELRTLINNNPSIHLNWQNDIDYVSQINGQVNYGVYKNENLIGGLSIHSTGRISFLWIDLQFRNKGISRGLINYAVKELKLEKLSISFTNNAHLLGFLKRLDFEKDKLSQYEMYLTL